MEFNPENNKNVKENVIDEEKLRKLKYRVYLLERDNYKTKKLKDNEIVDRIIKMIAQEVDNVN